MSRKFSQTKLEQFRKTFIEKRDQIISSIKKADYNIDVEGDEVDMIQSSVIAGLSNALSARDIKTLERIAYTLEKIETGEFGLCEECGHAIGEKRLMAVPGVETCISCAEEQERSSKQYRLT